MKASSFISSRIFFKGKVAVISLAVSYVVMIVALSVVAGFRHKINTSLSELVGDVSVHSIYDTGIVPETPILSDSALQASLTAVAGVKSVRPVIYANGIVRKDGIIHGAVFKGVSLPDSSLMKVSIPNHFARLMNLTEGDRMLSYFVGENTVVRNLLIQETYESIVTDNDKIVVFCSIDMLRRALRWDEGQISAYEISLDGPSRADSPEFFSILSEVNMYNTQEVMPLMVSTMEDYFPKLFGWLNLIDFNVLFILGLMTVVAAFNMVTGLLILLFQNIRTIGILKTLGMSNGDISRTFLRASSFLVFKGMVAGNLIAVALCLVEKYTGLFRLNPENYFVSSVPVHIDVAQILVCDALSYVLIMLFLLIPCTFISKVDPAKSVNVR